MNPISISMLATFFTTSSACVGLPSIAFLVFYAIHQAMKFSASSASGTNFGSNPDAVLLTLKWMTAAIDAVGSLASALAQFVLNGLAIASAVGLVLAIVCWFTGHGLSAHAGWARVSAGVILVLLLLVSLLLALSFDKLNRLPMLAIAGVCLMALHAVWTGDVKTAR